MQTNNTPVEIKLTKYSHGAGCGCKISPALLDQILLSKEPMPASPRLLVGNQSRDDAAVYDLRDGQALIATTDFFMPIVDDPYEFGRIASANAISDVYAMGGHPILAIAILGWPLEKLSPEIAQRVLEGSRSICREAGIPLAGGHSIDSPEPIFGLAVNGLVSLDHIKKNNKARTGDLLLLTKPLGVGILTTAEKKGLLKKEHHHIASQQMMELNRIGTALGKIDGVSAMTDVTGFGLLGHLLEMAAGSGLSAVLRFDSIPLIISDLASYVEKRSVPGGTERNLKSYEDKIRFSPAQDLSFQKAVLADPQTSGGLLIAVKKESLGQVQELMHAYKLEKFREPIGEMIGQQENVIEIL